jgi:hypothetical protein
MNKTFIIAAVTLVTLFTYIQACVYINTAYTPFCKSLIAAQGSGESRYSVVDSSGFQQAQENADAYVSAMYTKSIQPYNGTSLSQDCKNSLKVALCFAAFPKCSPSASSETSLFPCTSVCNAAKTACPADYPQDLSVFCQGTAGSGTCYEPTSDASVLKSSLIFTIVVAVIATLF